MSRLPALGGARPGRGQPGRQPLRILDPLPLEEIRLRTFDFYQSLRPRETVSRPVVIVDIDAGACGRWRHAGHIDEDGYLADFEERRKTEYVPMACMVQMNIALGRLDAAFEWLGKAADYRASFMLPIKVYPFFDPIRAEPSFVELVGR